MNSSSRKLTYRITGGTLLALLIGTASEMSVGGEAPQKPGKQADLETGRELFAREWVPNDSRSHGGDGLGPVFNDSSCVACHNQGGTGGAGPLSKNVDIISASSRFGRSVEVSEPSQAGKFFRAVFGLDNGSDPEARKKAIQTQRERERNRLAKIHPGFRSSTSVVLHRFGTDPNYAQWRQGMAGSSQFSMFGLSSTQTFAAETQEQSASIAAQKLPENIAAKPGKNRLREFERIQNANRSIEQVKAELGTNTFSRTSFHNDVTVTTTQRNPIALFGAGLIDSIPDEAIEAAARKKRYREFPEIEGRVCRLKDGKIGRFGWKAQKSSLYDFAMTACAVELGLHVPDHPQAGVPLQVNYKPAGLDMNQDECDALVAYLKVLPAPTRLESFHEGQQKYLAEGEKLFTSVGCAACHTSKLGNVEGIYSDLLLHDIGEDMVDTGEYGAFTPDSPGDEPLEQIELPLAKSGDDVKENQKAVTLTVGAKRAEWRTPPLWGVRDSAPYLHDGRAQTLKQAIAFHGGEGRDTAIRFFSLTTQEQQQLIAFLKSLTAPEPQQFKDQNQQKLLSLQLR